MAARGQAGSQQHARKAGEPADLSADQITTAALELLDSGGSEALTLRKLAAELGVSPSAIYWHIPSREALVASVVGKAMSGVVPREDSRAETSWDEWLRVLFRRYRNSVRKHPNVAVLLGSQLATNAESSMELAEAVLATMFGAGFRDDDLVGAYNTVIGALLGWVTLELAQPPKHADADWAALQEARVRSLSAASYPTVAAHLDRMANRAFILRWTSGSGRPLNAAFERYLDTVIGGLAAQLPD